MALAAYLLLYLSWLAFHWLPGGQEKVGDLFFIPIGAAAVLSAWGASRRCVAEPRLRGFWRLFALAVGAQLAGDTIMAIYAFGPGAAPFPSLADPPYLAFYLFMGLALLQVPVAPSTRQQRLRIGLDVATAVLGGGMAIWYFVLAPTLTQGGANAIELATSVAYPVGDIVLLACIAIVSLRWSPPVMRQPLALIATGLALFIVADVIYGYALLHSGYSAGGPLDGLWIAAIALFALAAGSQRRLREDDAGCRVPIRAEASGKVSWIPFAALLVGFATLLVGETNLPLIPNLSLLFFAIGVAVLVAVRQYLAQQELIRVQSELREAYEELARLAAHDPLTEVANRTSIEMALEEETRRARRYRREFAVLFADIDRFKAVNDEHGHGAGDLALREFAEVLGGCLRPTDRCGRWGGEEFVIVLAETGPSEALAVAERVCESVAEHPFGCYPDARLTCSIGVACSPGDAGGNEELLELADRAMYRAKQEGRNRVIAAAELRPETASGPPGEPVLAE